MNAQPREIPIIDLWTGKPWVAEPEPESASGAMPGHSSQAVVPGKKSSRSPSSGPPIAPHRFDDATALDLADAREERRCRCNRSDHRIALR